MDGRPIGDLDRRALTQAVAFYAQERASETLRIKTVTSRSTGKQVEYSLARLGFRVSEKETSELIWSRGRQLNPVLALVDHLRAFTGGVEVRPLTEVDDDRYQVWVASAADELTADPVEAELDITGTSVTFVDAQPGLRVDPDVVAARVLDTLSAGDSLEVEIPATERLPEQDADKLKSLVDQAERAVSGPLRLTRGEATIELAAAEIGDLLSVVKDDGEPRLAIAAVALDAAIGDQARVAFEHDPVDAGIRLSGGGVVIDASQRGFRFDPNIAADQITAVATSEASEGHGAREAEIDGVILEPGFTTAEAEALRITERVSSFTTKYPAGQSRVQNIHRMADLVDGVVLQPGERFSINEHVGPRTREGGFTDGGVIIDGEFETEVGGGVSQFATTFFNAAFFGGYEIVRHQPHSYYISRYPEGREATLNYPDVDVVIRNNSPYGLLIATSYTATSVTVEMWGTAWVDVEAWTSERRNVKEPELITRESRKLAPGDERSIQSGRQGFTVSYGRVLRYSDGHQDEQSWTHTYLPEPRIIERGSQNPPEPEALSADVAG
ncbi:MAG: VanW family protein [Thermoleophilia bacterium]|nr:VanW family protein [Thermoleophilia bacterium]